MGKAYIIIGIDDEKSEKDWYMPPSNPKEWIPNPYRSGAFVAITDQGLQRLAQFIGDSEDWFRAIIANRWGFMEHDAMEKLGLLDPEIASSTPEAEGYET